MFNRALMAFAMAMVGLALSDTVRPADQPAAAPTRLYSSTDEIAALLRQADMAAKDNRTLPEEARLLPSWGPYQSHLIHRSAPQPLYYTNDDYAEYFLILDGEGTFTMGGKLVNPKRTGPRAEASGVEGATVHKVAKGDMLMVPPGVAHAINEVHGRLVYMSMHMTLPADLVAKPLAAR